MITPKLSSPPFPTRTDTLTENIRQHPTPLPCHAVTHTFPSHKTDQMACLIIVCTPIVNSCIDIHAGKLYVLDSYLHIKPGNVINITTYIVLRMNFLRHLLLILVR